MIVENQAENPIRDRAPLFRCSNYSLLVFTITGVTGGTIATLAALSIFGGVNTIGFLVAAPVGGTFFLISSAVIIGIFIARCARKGDESRTLDESRNSTEALPGMTDEQLLVEIRKAITEHEEERLQKLLENQTADFINTNHLLHQAVEYGTPEQVQVLIDKGAQVQVLIDNGENVKVIDDRSEQPIQKLWLNTAHHEEILDVLCDNGADVNVKTNGFNLLFVAARSKNDLSELIRGLVNKGANIDERLFSQTALHAAAAAGSSQNVSILIELGANTDARNSFDETPLQVARRRKEDSEKSAIIEILEHPEQTRESD